MKRIDQDIKEGKLNNVYLLYGTESYLRNQYRDKLKNVLCNGDDTLNVSRYSGKDINLDEIIDLAETMPFLSDKRVIIIEDSGLFQGATDEKFSDYMKQVPETTFFVFSEESVDKRLKLYKAVKSVGYCSEFNGITPEELQRWINSYLKKANKQITNRAYAELISRCGSDMHLLKSEMEKLIAFTYGKAGIDIPDIQSICIPHTEDKIFVMLEDIMAGRVNEAFNLYGDLLDLQEEPGRILSMIIRQLRLMLHVKDMTKEGKNAGEMASTLGVEPFVIRKVSGQINRTSSKSIKKAIELCVQTEQDSRRGKIDIQIGTELIIASLSEVLQR